MQEERQRAREKCESELDNLTVANNEMPVEEILQAELAVDPQMESYLDAEDDPVSSICQAADKQLFSLVDWAKRIPHFMGLPTDDQVTLLRAGNDHAVFSQLLGVSTHKCSIQKCSCKMSLDKKSPDKMSQDKMSPDKKSLNKN